MFTDKHCTCQVTMFAADALDLLDNIELLDQLLEIASEEMDKADCSVHRLDKSKIPPTCEKRSQKSVKP